MPITDFVEEIPARRNNFGLALSIVIAIAVAMTAVTITVFLRSGAYVTVKQIQIGSHVSYTFEEGDLDVTSPIKSTDIDELAKNVYSRVQVLNDDVDFGSSDVTDVALTLTP